MRLIAFVKKKSVAEKFCLVPAFAEGEG